jgi:tetratricopeptide (TPR) repeat protein
MTAVAAPHRDEVLALDESKGLLRGALETAALRIELGHVEQALSVLDGTRALVEGSAASDVDRATFRFHLGCARLALGAVAEASSELTLALDLANRASEPSDRLRALILERRARCHRHNRDWSAARSDVERALELAEALGDDRTIAQACFQASIIAERESQWIMAQFYAERARGLFVELGDVFGVGKCLNNLGGLAFLLDKPDEARRLLKESFQTLLDLGRDVEAAYAVSSLAQVQLRSGEAEDAERLARRALVFIGSRVDHRTELGNAQLVLGRALLEQGRLDEADETFRVADRTLERAALGERAAVWLAQGEAATRRGEAEEAAALYRRAAEALQDFHF